LFFETVYFVSPELNQIRLVCTAKAYRYHPKYTQPPRIFDRNYEYLSSSRSVVLRPFHEGEKEAMIAEIEDGFAYLVERYPANLEAYEEDRKATLKFLKRRDVIPPAMAMAEGWPGMALQDELQRATDHMLFMLQQDLKNIGSPIPKVGDYIRFNGLDSLGKPDKLKGYFVSTLGPNTIYRDKKGDMYSVPSGAN